MMYKQDLADFASINKDGENDVDCNNDNSIDCDDFLDHDDEDSDEDTEDASETDMVMQHEEEIMKQDKLATLKKQLAQLEEGSHPEYLERLRKIEQLYQERRLMNEVFQSHEVDRVEREYTHEKKAAVREFNYKKRDLRKSLIMDLQKKRRKLESEQSTIKLTGGSSLPWCTDPMKVKSVTTSKPQRTPNDPLPTLEKRRKTSPPQLNLLLDEGEILDDLKILNKGKTPSVSKKIDYEEYGNVNHGTHAIEVRIEDGKLFYEWKC